MLEAAASGETSDAGGRHEPENRREPVDLGLTVNVSVQPACARAMRFTGSPIRTRNSDISIEAALAYGKPRNIVTAAAHGRRPCSRAKLTA